jgi:hypothetical protein
MPQSIVSFLLYMLGGDAEEGCKISDGQEMSSVSNVGAGFVFCCLLSHSWYTSSSSSANEPHKECSC